jgi:predicted lysophospholipase L1 biosynthesis ABC-type transport system permease subunit
MPPAARSPSLRDRMSFKMSLGECVASALVALFVGTFAGSVLLALGMMLLPPHRGGGGAWYMAPGFAFVLMMPAFPLAAPVTLLVGLPAYAWLRAQGWASVFTVLAVVAVVALVVAMTVDASLAKIVAVYGACIGLLTHALQQRRDARMRPQVA